MKHSSPSHSYLPYILSQKINSPSKEHYLVPISILPPLLLPAVSGPSSACLITAWWNALNRTSDVEHPSLKTQCHLFPFHSTLRFQHICALLSPLVLVLISQRTIPSSIFNLFYLIQPWFNFFIHIILNDNDFHISFICLWSWHSTD